MTGKEVFVEAKERLVMATWHICYDISLHTAL